MRIFMCQLFWAVDVIIIDLN